MLIADMVPLYWAEKNQHAKTTEDPQAKEVENGDWRCEGGICSPGAVIDLDDTTVTQQLNLIKYSEKTEDLHFAAKLLTWTVCHDIIRHVEILQAHGNRTLIIPTPKIIIPLWDTLYSQGLWCFYGKMSWKEVNDCIAACWMKRMRRQNDCCQSNRSQSAPCIFQSHFNVFRTHHCFSGRRKHFPINSSLVGTVWIDLV